MVIGAIIIKHTLCSSDEGTIAFIQENPYMQYLIGLKYFRETPIFSPELFVTLRKRIDEISLMASCFPYTRKKCIKKSSSSGKNYSDSARNSCPQENFPVTHKGKMKIDSTLSDAEMLYPKDINILDQPGDRPSCPRSL